MFHVSLYVKMKIKIGKLKIHICVDRILKKQKV